MMVTTDGTIDEIVNAAAHVDFCISAAVGGGYECTILRDMAVSLVLTLLLVPELAITRARAALARRARKARKEARHG